MCKDLFIWNCEVCFIIQLVTKNVYHWVTFMTFFYMIYNKNKGVKHDESREWFRLPYWCQVMKRFSWLSDLPLVFTKQVIWVKLFKQLIVCWHVLKDVLQFIHVTNFFPPFTFYCVCSLMMSQIQKSEISFYNSSISSWKTEVDGHPFVSLRL